MVLFRIFENEKKEEVHAWFGGISRYLQYHQDEHKNILGDIRLEDD